MSKSWDGWTASPDFVHQQEAPKIPKPDEQRNPNMMTHSWFDFHHHKVREKHYVSLSNNYIGEAHPIVVACINRPASGTWTSRQNSVDISKYPVNFANLSKKATKSGCQWIWYPKIWKPCFDCQSSRHNWLILVGLKATFSWGSWNLFSDY